MCKRLLGFLIAVIVLTSGVLLSVPARAEGTPTQCLTEV